MPLVKPPEDLKEKVCKQMVGLVPQDRERLIREFVGDLRRNKIIIEDYLLPVGIGNHAEFMTPAETGHLVRFMSNHVPRSAPVIDRFLKTLGVERDENNQDNNKKGLASPRTRSTR